MAIDLATGFNIGSKDAIDERQVLTLEQMKNLDESIYPDKYFAICKDNGKLYLYNVNNIVDSETGKFRVLEGNTVGDGTTDSAYTTVVFDKSIDMGKYFLLAKITNANYANNIIKFSCPDFKGQNDVGFRYENDMDILKFELHFNTGSMRETNGYGVTLKQHGLGLYSYPLNNPQNTSPEIKDAVRLYWDYSKGEIYVFLVELMTAIPHCVLEYTGNGTLLSENTFVNDNLYNRMDGVNGTWEESKWKSIPYNKLETPPIYELGGDGGSTECVKTYTSLTELGLTAPVSVGEIFNAMPNKTIAILACESKDEDGGTVNISDIPTAFGVLTIKKNEKSRFSIEYQNSLQGSPCDVKRWIGTLKGLDGTGLYWKQLSAEPTFVALTDIGLTADATFQDVIDTLPKGGSALLGVTEFTNYQTIFPYEEGNDQFARVHIVKGTEDGSRAYARWFRKDGVKEAIAIFNINDNKFNGWQVMKTQQIYNSLNELGLDTTATINDIIGAMKDGTTFTYKTDVFDYATEYNNIQLGTVTINKQSTHRVQALMTDKSTGNLYVGKLDGNNQIVGWTKVITEYSDPYVCTSYKALTGTEDLFTLPCGHYVSANINTTYNYPVTDSDKATAHIYVLGCLNDPANNKGYRIILYFDNKNRMYRINEWWGSFSNGWQKIQTENCNVITADTITKYGTEILKYPVGTWCLDSVNLGKQFTDLPLTGGMAGIIEIDSIYPTKSPYEHAYGYRNYTFRDALTTNIYVRTLNSGDTAGTLQRDTGWKKVCTDETRLTTVETQVSELFQSVSDGKTLVANAITGKGVSTSTTATFATMATNIGKISGGYKEETKSLIVTSNTTGTEALKFTFSANVIAVKQIVAPSYEGYSNGTCYVVTSTSKNIFSISGKNLSLYVKGTGRWEVTALVQA